MNQNQIETSLLYKALYMFKYGNIKPHAVLYGKSGAGKTYNVVEQCNLLELDLVTINTPALVAQGLIVDKLLPSVANRPNAHWVVYFDEFDKHLTHPSEESEKLIHMLLHI